MYNKFGISDKAKNLVLKAEKSLTEEFKKIDDMCDINSLKVLKAFNDNKISEAHFGSTTGYGYDDIGRDAIERVFSSVLESEDAIVRSQFISGSHALCVCLFAFLRPGDLMLSITGTPYDTLHEVIGIKENKSSLKSFGIKYDEIDLLDNDFDYEKIENYIKNNKVKLIEIQRSKGYSTRKSIVIEKLEKVIKLIKKIDDDIINEFEIGLSMNDNNVSKLLEKKGYDVNELIDIGLCGKKDNFIYDIFRNRIMFPLYNLDGKPVGFSGRIYNGEKDSKYVNSKESIIFKKGNLLYNYHRALSHAREKHQIIVVEGFMDVIRLYTIGIKNVVATMGTAITKEHANLLMKLSKNIVLCFDGDKAGEKATISALDALEKIGITPKIIRLEDDLDPDDYIIKKGSDAYLTHLNNPMSSVVFKINIDKSKTNFNDYNEISTYLKNVSKELEKIDDKVVYELTVNKLSKETGVSCDTINDMVKSMPKNEIKVITKRTSLKKDKYQKAEEYLVHYMLRNVDAVLIYQNNVSYLNDPILSKIAMQILEFYEINRYINITDFTVFLEDKTDLIEKSLIIDDLRLPDEVNVDILMDYVKTIDEGILKREIEKTKKQIKEEMNVAKKISLTEKLRNLKKKECK